MEPDEASDSGRMTQDSSASRLLRTSQSSQSIIGDAETNAFSDSNFLIEHIKQLLAAERTMKQTVEKNFSLEKDNCELREENRTLRLEFDSYKLATTEPRCIASKMPPSYKKGGSDAPSYFDVVQEERNKFMQNIKDLKVRLNESNAQIEVREKTIIDLERALNLRRQSSSNIEEVREEMNNEQKKRFNAEKMVSNLEASIQKLEEEKRRDQEHITKLELETLETDYLRDQLVNQFHKNQKKPTVFGVQTKDESAQTSNLTTSGDIDEMRIQNRYSVPSSVEKGLTRMTEQMEVLIRGRRIQDIPAPFQSELPFDHQSGQIFHEISNVLKMILNGKRVNIKHLEELWISIATRFEAYDDAMKKKSNIARNLAQTEFKQIEETYQKEREKLKSEIQDVRMEKRLSLNKKLETELELRNEKIMSLKRIIESQANSLVQLGEANSQLNLRLKREIAAQQPPSAPSDRNDSMLLDIPEKRTSDGLSTVKELKKKLNSMEDDLISEQRSHQYMKITLEETISESNETKKKLKEALVKHNLYHDLIENAIIMLMAIQENTDSSSMEQSLGELKSILLSTAGDLASDQPNRPLPKNMPEDKEWLLNNFFNKLQPSG